LAYTPINAGVDAPGPVIVTGWQVFGFAQQASAARSRGMTFELFSRFCFSILLLLLFIVHGERVDPS
jgi:hypothetical protein